MTQFRYQMNVAPQARTDGFGVDHDITGIYSEDAGVSWQDLPGVHWTVVVPTADMKTVMDMPDGTGPQKQAKNQAYKEALRTNATTPPIVEPAPNLGGYSKEDFQEYLDAYNIWKAEFDANVAAALVEADRANDYITVTLGQTYPVQFAL